MRSSIGGANIRRTISASLWATFSIPACRFFTRTQLTTSIQALIRDAELVVGHRFSASGFFDALIAARATITFLLGAMVPILLGRPVADNERAHRVRIALAPGVSESFQVDFAARCGIALLDGYGSMETNYVIGGRIDTQHPGYRGRLVNGFDARVVDEHDQPVPDGTAGELILRAVFGHLFFPKGADPLLGTLAAFAGFGGFRGAAVRRRAIRPHRRSSRTKGRAGVALSIMGGATFLIGLLPTYTQVGLWATALLVTLRVLQGIASGGEWGGGVLMISESAPPEKRGYLASWSQIGVGGGFVLSAAVFFVMQMLPQDAFRSCGWRVPFLLSIFIFGVGVLYPFDAARERRVRQDRSGRQESAHAGIRCDPRASKRDPAGYGPANRGNGGSYIFLAFALVYGNFIGVPNWIMLAGVMVSMTVELFAMLMWGRLSDRVGRKPIYMIGGLASSSLRFRSSGRSIPRWRL